VVGLHVRLEDGDDRHVLGVGEGDVPIDQIGMRIDDGEPAATLAAEEIRGAGGFVVEELAEEQSGLRDGPELDKVSIDRLNNQVDSTRPKDALFEAIAVMGKAFASPRRLELIDLLAQGSRSVDELANASGQSTANTSQHLQALHAAGLVTRRRDGLRVRYSLAADDVLALWLALREASATRLAEVQRAAREYLGDEVEAIGRDELIARMARGDVVLVDVRPGEEFEAGHIDGAQSIPIEELKRRLDELPGDREVVAYCRGPFCAFAHEAVRTLRAEGRSARRLQEGWPEWRLARDETPA
jgi:rhodanese-related sulfurtransferase/predicted transcriptional regulator